MININLKFVLVQYTLFKLLCLGKLSLPVQKKKIIVFKNSLTMNKLLHKYVVLNS